MDQEYPRFECQVWGILNKADTPRIEKHGSVSTISKEQFEEMKQGGSFRITIDVHDSRVPSASTEDYEFTVTVKEFHKVVENIIKTITYTVPLSLDNFTFTSTKILVPNEFVIFCSSFTFNTKIRSPKEFANNKLKRINVTSTYYGFVVNINKLHSINNIKNKFTKYIYKGKKGYNETNDFTNKKQRV